MKFSIIRISETWLKKAGHLCDIPGYNYFHGFGRDRTGGGGGLYLSQEFEYKRRSDLCISNNCAESLFVEIIKTKEENRIVGDIYRPPDQSVPEFTAEID